MRPCSRGPVGLAACRHLCFFLHLCGGIRHLFWDAGRGFELRTIYASGWAVVAASTSLTVAAWVVSLYLGSS